MTTEKAADAVVTSSPLKVEVTDLQQYDRDPSMIQQWALEKAQPPGWSQTKHHDAQADHEIPSYDPLRPSFIVHVSKVRWPHKKMICASPLHGAWPRHDGDRAASYVSVDLAQSMPKWVGAEGMRIWDLESLRFSRNKHFMTQRLARRNVMYKGAVPELMSKRRSIIREGGLLAQALLERSSTENSKS